jgi:hypothetical protein
MIQENQPEIKRISLETSEYIKQWNEEQKKLKELFWNEVYNMGVALSKIIGNEN